MDTQLADQALSVERKFTCDEGQRTFTNTLSIQRHQMSLLTLMETENYTHLQTQWHPKNQHGPEHYSAHSHVKVWWLCSIKCANSDDCCHEWFATINSRTSKKSSCPFCSRRGSKPCCLKASVASSEYIHLQQQWSTKNKLKPRDCKIGSNHKIIWECQNTCDEDLSCKHQWSTSIYARQKNGCPFCAGIKVCCKCKSLDTPKYKHLLLEWHPENLLPPSKYRPRSGTKVKWICSKTCPDSTNCRHEWYASIRVRTNGNGCPFCSNRFTTPCCVFKSLANPKYKTLQDEWHSRNTNPPSQYYIGTRTKVWWTCSNVRSNNHEWYASILDRTQGSGCPFCKRSKMEENMALELECISKTPNQQRTILKFAKQRLPGSQEGPHTSSLEADFLVRILLDTKSFDTIIIELDGQQHFHPITFGSTTTSGLTLLRQCQARDRRKLRYCARNHIPILHIAYDVPITKYKKIVEDFICLIRGQSNLMVQCLSTEHRYEYLKDYETNFD